MAAEQYANAAQTTLSGNGGTVSSGATSFNVASGTGFPASGPFRILIGSELLIVGARSGATFSSVSPGAEGTSAASHSDGDTVTLVLTAASLLAVLERMPRGPGYGDPTLQSFSWVNQGSTTETALSDGGLYLETPNASGNHLRLRVKSAPSTPWTLTARLIPNVNLNLSGSPSYGLAFRESSSGKLHVIRMQLNASDHNPALIVDAWTDADTFSGSDLTYAAYLLAAGGYFRIADDGTNRLFSYSLDGVNFQQIFSVARTTFLTANQIGYFVNDNGAGFPMGVTLLSWTQG
jgi:hypothetical protein